MMKHRYNVVNGYALPFMQRQAVMKCILLLLLNLLLVLLATAQEKKAGIRGLVENEKGEPVEGVTVERKNESTGARQSTVTDKSGVFTFPQPSAKAVYVFTFSHVQYVTQTVRKESLDLQKEEAIYITLKDNSTALDVVVVSYGKQRRKEVTGSIVQQNAGDMQDMPVTQFAQQLQGKVAGMQVGQNSGRPGSGMEFRIRGAASLTGDNQPLFVVDGIPITGSINNINPSEIETFTVLKDASASSLYGSRAANGVILITTKHTRPGEAKVEFNGFYGSQIIPQKGRPKMMTAREFAEFQNEYYQDKVKYEGTGTLAPEYQNPERYGDGTNWFNALTRAAPIQNYDLMVSSATERSSSTLIAGYQNQQGVVLNTGTRLLSLRLNQDFTLHDNKLKIGFGLAPSYRLDHNNRLTTEGVGGLIEKIVEASPLIAPVDSNGNMPLYVNSPGMVANVNPYAQLIKLKDDYKTTRILGNAYLSYELVKGLVAKASIAVDKGAETRNRFSPASISTTAVATGLSGSVDNYSWTAEEMLTYTKTFFHDHHIEAMAGYSAQKFEQVSNSVTGTNFPSDDVEWLSAATSISAGSSNTTAYSLMSYIGRLNYNFRGTYLLSAAFRNDGSSRFGRLRKFGDFPSISAGWIVTNEKFMERFPVVDFLKLRVSYGITGNNSIGGNYLSLSQITASNYVFNGQLASGSAFSNLGNAQLAWERNKQFDAGLDVSVLNNRITFTYDYYHKISDALVQDRPIPRASGFTVITSNVGQLEFWGHEFSATGEILTGAVKWSSAFNISFDKNKIKYLVSPGYFRRNNTITSDYYRDQVGHHLGEFYGFVFDGLYKDDNDLNNSARYGSNSAVGTIKMKDVVPDKVINENDRTFIGDPNPDFLFGFSNNLSYKNFDLSVSMAGSYGGKILNPSKWAYLANLDGARALLSAVKDRWRSPENPGSGIYPRTLTNTTALGRSVNSQWVEDGSYLSVKNITLGYNFIFKGNSLVKNFRLYASVQHALILTRYTGINPEVSLNGLNGTGIGIDENAYPVPRVFAAGFSASFK